MGFQSMFEACKIVILDFAYLKQFHVDDLLYFLEQ